MLEALHPVQLKGTRDSADGLMQEVMPCKTLNPRPLGKRRCQFEILHLDATGAAVLLQSDISAGRQLTTCSALHAS